MSHELEILADGTASMAYVGDTPWHHLGTKVDANLTPAQMQTAAGLDWDVIEEPTFVRFNGVEQPTGRKALLRSTDGRVLTEVGPNWHPVQNSEAFEFFTDFVAAGDMEMHTAGSLRNGEIVWALAKVKEDFTLFGGDRVESHLLFSNPHQYGKTVNVRFTPTRVVCQNTLSMALSSSANAAVSLNHRKAFDPEAVKTLLGVATVKLASYKEMAEFLGSKRTTEDTIKQYFGDLLGTSNTKKDELSPTGKTALEVLHTQPGANFAEGSWWQAFNTITYMTDHLKGRSDDTRTESAWFGGGAKLKTKALELALDMANAA